MGWYVQEHCIYTMREAVNHKGKGMLRQWFVRIVVTKEKRGGGKMASYSLRYCEKCGKHHVEVEEGPSGPQTFYKPLPEVAPDCGRKRRKR